MVKSKKEKNGRKRKGEVGKEKMRKGSSQMLDPRYSFATLIDCVEYFIKYATKVDHEI